MPGPDEIYDEAIELKEAGKLEAAVGKLEELVEAHPDFALGHSGLGVFYGKLDRTPGWASSTGSSTATTTQSDTPNGCANWSRTTRSATSP